MKIRALLIAFFTGFMVILASGYVGAQDCFTLVSQMVTQTLQSCAAAAPGDICRGGVISGGETSLVIRSTEAVVIRPTAETNLFAFGTLTLSRGGGAWTAFEIQQTGAVCPGSSYVAGVLAQTAGENPAALTVNGVRVTFTRTIFFTLHEGALQVSVLEGEAQISTRSVPAGFEWTESGGVAPYDYAVVGILPVNLLPRVPRVPLPGQAEVTEQTRLYARPSESSARLLDEVPPGTIVQVYGADISGTWRHVRTPDDQSGWIPASALDYSVSINFPAYEATPQLMSRPFGGIWGRGSTGSGEVNFRTGPGFDEGILGVLPPDFGFSILGRSADLEWLYVRLDDPLNGISEGWVNIPFVDIDPPDLRIGELPPVP